MNMSKSFSVCAVIAASLAIAAEASAAVYIADYFNLNVTNREAGDVLNGVTSEVGGKVWDASTDLKFEASTAVSMGTSARSAVLPASPADAPGETHFYVEAGIRPAPLTRADLQDNTNINFRNSSNTGGSGHINSSDVLLVSLWENGRVQLWQGFTLKADVNTPGVWGYNANQYNIINLAYDSLTSTATVTANGVALASNVAVTPITFSRVGFGAEPSDGTSGMFSYIAFGSVPEPASFVLLASGLALGLKRRGARC